ncbi:hypothetical protein [Nocardia wallacei]|uniref:hypothetical protein n=1 Tax=Nocardia wallacei TaxID=480035 RepID=UPI002458D636|nr:hypothetical protein [Nocardia wallacei]
MNLDGLLSALNDAATKYMDTLGRGHKLPPLTWRVEPVPTDSDTEPPFPTAGLLLTGQAGAEYLDDEVADVVPRWAAALGLDIDTEGAMPGLAAYAGRPVSDDWPGGKAMPLLVRVWGVQDRDAWDGHGQREDPPTG